MIVYRQTDTLARDLGIPGQTLYAVSNDLSRHYRTVELPKGDGAVRKLSVPSPLLKRIQRRIGERLLSQMPVSPYATAYRWGVSPLKNAAIHAGQPLVLNLDISHFFDSVLYRDVKEFAFPAEIYAEPLRVLLSMLCYHGNALPQGAPTSPAISNLVLREFDIRVGRWCRERHIRYSRYCDDMTFSGSFDAGVVTDFVAAELRKQGFFLNSKKTRLIRQGQRQTVTGLVVNEKVSVPASYRRQLRQELRFCEKFGIEGHLCHTGSPMSREMYLQSLLGRLNYVLQTEPNHPEFRRQRLWLMDQLHQII